MRRVLLICLLLVACQGHDEERIKKLEKEVADLKANPPTQTVAAPSPSPLSTAQPDPTPASEGTALRQDVAEDCVKQGVCAYVSLASDPMAGLVYQDPKGVTTLFRWDKTKSLFMSVTTVDPIIGDNHRASISDAQMNTFRALLEKQP